MVFANHSREDVTFPITVKKIAQAQKDDIVLKKLQKHDKCSTHLVEDTQLLCPQFFRTKQLAVITTTCSILNTAVLKRHYT
jgi:hypothetical protein